LLLALSVSATAFLAACASSSTANPSASSALYGTAIQQQCTSVADVLSDGPDPTADPVGYAEAQVLPLRRLKITDKKLASAVTALASAYQAYAARTGPANTVRLATSKAENSVNAICPGAAN
jgi:hypothetical protein